MMFHCAFDLDYILHRCGARSMAGNVRLPGASDLATEAEVLTHATLLKARGFEVMPTCDQHDERGYCLGHKEAQ